MIRDQAAFVWTDPLGEGRNPFAMFRLAFDPGGPVRSAKLHLFADTAYQLFVNGEFVEFGPVRFDPRHPLYDTHELSDRLVEGRNVIAVLVNFVGHPTFHTASRRAGLIAWGAVETDGGRVELATGSAPWKAMAAAAYAAYSPRLSFALQAQERYDQRVEEPGWKERDFDDSRWPSAERLADPSSWGPLAPRGIPYMSGASLMPERVVHALPLRDAEARFSFRMPAPFRSRTVDKQTAYSSFAAFATWAYSPIDQTVVMGTFYGDFWLNGEKLEGFPHPLRSLRYNRQARLRHGWNRLFGTVAAYQDILEHYIAFPREAEIVLSADKTEGSSRLFKHTRFLRTEEYESLIRDKPVPYAEDDELAEIGGWTEAGAGDAGQSPCLESAWDEYGQPLESLSPELLTGRTFDPKRYPHGFSLLLDFGRTVLVFPQIALDGAADAVVDVTYGARLDGDGQHILQQHWVPLGDRIRCGEAPRMEWMPVHPRGMRYMMVTVRGAKADVTVRRLAFRSAHYPAEDVGAFRCSDNMLNRIWEMGRLTLATNMEDAYDDCVDRERGMYVLDTVIQYYINLAVFGDQRLMRRCLELYAQSCDDNGMFRAVYPTVEHYTLPGFGLYMLEGYAAYYEHTGDTELIHAAWPAIRRNLRRFHRLADLRADLLLLADEPDPDDPGSPLIGLRAVGRGEKAKGPHGPCSSLYLFALRGAAMLAEAIGDEAELAELRGRIGVLERSIPSAFWNAERGCFSNDEEGRQCDVLGNLYAARAGLVSEERMPSVRAFLRRHLASIFVNGVDPSDDVVIRLNDAHAALDGLYRLGMAGTAERIMKEGWGLFAARGLVTVPEHFNYSGSSLCHAWSASPTYYLSKQALGVHFPQAPNLDEVEIRVSASGIAEAEGTYPHPRGAIEVKWHMEDGKRVFDRLRGPEGVNIRVAGAEGEAALVAAESEAAASRDSSSG